MGASASNDQVEHIEIAVPVPVTLNIYNVGTSEEVRAINKVLRVLGTGAFHCGVEVYDSEWSYRGTGFGMPGVFSRRPRQCEGHIYSESVSMGVTLMSRRHVHDVIRVLSRDWPGSKYDLLKYNCCHFCDAFCKLLGVGQIPGWITNLASTGAAIMETGEYIGRRTISFGDKVDSAFCGQISVTPGSPSAASVSCGVCLCGPGAGGRNLVESY